MQIPAPLPWVVSVEGATASGKTAVALAIATGFGVPVISADARQCYRELRIGVARPTPEELALAPHYFIADRSVQEPLSAGAFEREALSLLKQLHSAHNVVVVAGGSGLYVKALLEGFDHFPPVPEKIRSELRATLELQGISALQELLLSEDPDYYREVDRHNPHRLLRALEVCRSAGLPYSSFRKILPGSRKTRLAIRSVGERCWRRNPLSNPAAWKHQETTE